MKDICATFNKGLEIPVKASKPETESTDIIVNVSSNAVLALIGILAEFGDKTPFIYFVRSFFTILDSIKIGDWNSVERELDILHEHVTVEKYGR